MKILSIKAILLLICVQASSQDLLNLNDAITIGLKNNYNIIITSNELNIAQNDNSRGNAGMLPSVSLNSGLNYSGNNTKQEFTTGNNVDKIGARSNNFNTNIELNWTLFDGMKMFITKDKLHELESMSSINLKIQIENIVSGVTNVYYDIVRQKKLLNNHQILLNLYEERLKIAKTKFEIGNGTKSDYLHAQLDYNTQKAARIKLNATLDELKTKLNVLISRPVDIVYDVIDEIIVNKKLKLDEISSLAMRNNLSLLFQQSNINLNEFSLQEIKTERFPNIFLNASYNFSRTKNQVGFLLYNQNLGWNTGLTASWSLFNGFNISREIKNAAIRLKNAKLQADNAKIDLQSSLINSYRNYTSALEALALEEENIKLAKENMDIIMDSFRLGRANTLEFKDAQKSYEDALTRLLQTLYETKLAETELLRLKGELVK